MTRLTVDDMIGKVAPGSDESLAMVSEIARDIAERYDRAYWLDHARRKQLPAEQWQAFADSGLLRLSVPRELGGAGFGASEHVAAMETLAEHGVASHFFIVNTVTQIALALRGTPEQQARYLAPLLDGTARLCMAITEPVVGTNIFKLKTTAVRDGDRFIVNGEKIYVTGADEAHAMLTILRTPGEPAPDPKRPLSLMAIDLDLPGVRLEKMAMDLGWPENQCRVVLENVSVPASNVIGPLGEGLSFLWHSMNTERLIVPGKAIGLGRFALRKAVDFARQRKPYDAPIGAYQAVQHPLARAELHLRAARLATYDAARRFDRGEKVLAEVNGAKYLASEACIAAVTAAMQVMGGTGFDSESDLYGLVPIAHLTARGPINNEMVLNYIAERVLGLPKSY